MNKYKMRWCAALAAMAGDITLSVIFALFYSDYDWMKMSISALGNPQSPVRFIFDIWMLIEGFLFLAVLPAVYKRYYSISKKMTIAMMIQIGLFAIGACIFTCFFSVDETNTIVTTAMVVHEIGSIIGFISLLFVPLLLAILSFKSNDRNMGILFMVCFIIAFIFFALFVMSDKPEFADKIISNMGLWERLNLIFMYLPVTIISIKELNMHSR